MTTNIEALSSILKKKWRYIESTRQLIRRRLNALLVKYERKRIWTEVALESDVMKGEFFA